MRNLLAAAAATLIIWTAPAAAHADADLTMTGSGNPQPAEAGQTVTHTFVVRNASGGPAERVIYTNSRPDHATWESASCASPSDRRALTLGCDLGTLAPGQSVAITVVLRTERAGELRNHAGVRSQDTPDPNQGNNSVTVVSQVTGSPGDPGGPTDPADPGAPPGPGPPPPSFAPPACDDTTALRGDSGPNILVHGAAEGVKILGRGGNDRLAGFTGDDCVFGHAGRDRALGGDGDDLVSGGSGNDLVGGGAGDDNVKGDSGSDRVNGGAGADYVSGGRGNDVVAAADGTKDVLRCGRGRDRVTADRVDHVSRDCEKVKRRR